jgi:head-tail adaptor
VQTAGSDELTRAGVSLGAATHVLVGRFHPAVTLKARLVVRGRTFEVTGVQSPDELQIETIAACTELIGAPLPTEVRA